MQRLLVVVDMQNDFIDGALGSAEAQAILPAVAKKIETFDGEVVFTMDTHDAAYRDTQEGRLLPVAHCLAGTQGWALPTVLEGLQKQRRAKVYQKGAFGSEALAADVKQMCIEGLKEVVLIGVCTDICVISNAMLLKAAAPELRVTVDAACCAGVTPKTHQTALDAMRQCQIYIENE